MPAKLYDGFLTLAELESALRQDEEIIGTVTAISVSGTQTQVTYDAAADAAAMPEKSLSLATFADTPPAKPNLVVVLVGRGIVERKEARLAAYR